MCEPESVDSSSSAIGSKDEESPSQIISTKDKLSIEKILEGMTNEFNKTGAKKSVDSIKRISRTETAARKQEKVQIKVTEENTNVKKVQKPVVQVEEEIKVIKENIPEKKIEKVKNTEEVPAKQETANNKKDGNPTRIVLTFRTIDENTDHGKKTKISSLPSNLSLVPDEFANCDQISGVSVKIENFDEVCSNGNKPESEENNSQCIKIVKNNKLPTFERLEKDSPTRRSIAKKELSVQGKMDLKINLNNDSDKNEKTQMVDKERPKRTLITTELSPIKKGRQKRVREPSFSEEKVLKRSARRLSKESPNSTVLESAMARKERSNYTEESTKRKYNRPGRPRKSLPDKTIDKSPEKISDKTKEKSPDKIKEKTPDKTKEKTPDKLKEKTPDKVPDKPDKKDVIPKLKPIDSTKTATDKKDEMPKLNPLNPPKLLTDKKALPKLCPLIPPKTIPIDTNGTIEDIVKLNKYEGMPKLTPIVKSCEVMKLKLSNDEVNNLFKNPPPLKIAAEHFLKPTTTKAKLSRNMVRLPGIVKKSIKENGSEESASTSADESMDGYRYLTLAEDDYPTPAKRTRRAMIPSPNTAEGQASKPESTAILSKACSDKVIKKQETMQCLCEVGSQLFVTITSAETPLCCTALDSVDSRIIGCVNQVDQDDVAMRRPSAKIPYIILCRMHKERLIKHNCCPTCGLFCSQGKFVHCSNGHQYHRNCEMIYEGKSLCPHCGSQGLSYDVIITMTGKRKPVYIPPDKQVSKGPTAKITLPGSGDNTKLAEQQPSPKRSNEPLIDPETIRIPEPTTDKSDKTERYTIMSLYNAVKNGELQKLVNVLANGFNANHTFREQGHRTALHVAAEKGFLACVHVLVQGGAQLDVLDRNQLTPLMLAASNGKAEVVRYLMRIGTDVTLKGEDGMTALHMAAKSGHLEVCQIILSECKVPRTLVDSVDDGGWTSLIWACEFRHADIARFLINNKCDPLIRDSEQNIALHWSAFSGSSEITELLIDMGCDVNAVNVHGDTPLHIASRQDQYAVCVLLLSRGSKVNEINSLGETAIDCCGGTGDTLKALQLNFKVNQNAEHMLEKTVRILTNDISRGKEMNPVQCVNGYDIEDKPTDFVYVTENCFTSKINVDRTISSLQSCRCEDNCGTDKCLCGNISLRCWYDDEGKLVPEFNYADPPMLFECNPACDCNRITCNNRVVQHGLTQRFQLFRTDGKGWGIRTLRHIPKGTYVCEYVGEIISDSEADQREDDSYLFDLDNRDGETYCIDARRYGNLARFINHSCAPNLLPVRVYIEHQDLHFPRIAFFANRDIEADEELGFDYGEKFWIIKCKSFTCTCGAENCRYSEKTIQTTLDAYRQRIQREETLTAQASSLASVAKT